MAQERTIRLVVADDHPVFREGLVRSLAARTALEVVGEAADGTSAHLTIAGLVPDVALLDVRMPGLPVLEVLRRAGTTRVVLLSGYEDPDLVYAALAEGAAGFLTKTSAGEVIAEAVEAAGRGEVVLSPDVQTLLAGEIRQRAHAARPALTEREAEVLRLVADGASTTEIAAALFLGVSTVKHHLASLYQKLEVNDRAAAVAVAMRRGLLG